MYYISHSKYLQKSPITLHIVFTIFNLVPGLIKHWTWAFPLPIGTDFSQFHVYFLKIIGKYRVSILEAANKRWLHCEQEGISVECQPPAFRQSVFHSEHV